MVAKIRSEVLFDQARYPDTGGWVESIEVGYPVSAIDVILEATNGATSNKEHPLHKDITKVEVVDGSEVFHSLSLLQGEALSFYENRTLPRLVLKEAGGDVQQEGYRIMFGRYIGDPEYYLDVPRMRNPQIKVTGDLTISATAGFVSGSGKITVIAHIIEEGALPQRGYLRASQIYSWTTAAAGDEIINLPTDSVHRLVMVRAFDSGVAIETNLDKIQVNCDFGKYVPYNHRTESLIDMNAERFGEVEVTQEVFATDANTRETYLNKLNGIAVNALNDFDLASVDAEAAGKVTIQLLSLTATPTIAKSTTDQRIKAVAKGFCFHNTITLPYGDLAAPESWFDATRFTSVRLIATQAAAGAAASVVLQEVKTQV